MAQQSVKPENVWNFDETAVGILRPGSSGWASKGLKKIAFIGPGDKRNWTAVVGTYMLGDKTLCQVLNSLVLSRLECASWFSLARFLTEPLDN